MTNTITGLISDEFYDREIKCEDIACPHCNKQDITVTRIDINGKFLFYRFGCYLCNHEWERNAFDFDTKTIREILVKKTLVLSNKK
jgi:transposase-like protein